MGRALAIGLLLVSACSALRLRETYIAHGDVIEIAEDSPDDRKPSKKDAAVRLFLESAPEGFEMFAGQAVVQPGYAHRVLGRIELTLGRGTCDPGDGNHLSREAVFARLRKRAHRAGGDALVYVRTRARDVWMSDCDRLDQSGARESSEPWAEGWIVVLEPPEPDGGVPGAGAAPPTLDGGLVDAQQPPLGAPSDAGVPFLPDAGTGPPAMPLSDPGPPAP